MFVFICKQSFQDEGIKEEDEESEGSDQRLQPPRPLTTTTAIPIDVTTRATTRRPPPRVKSNIRLASKNPSIGKTKLGNRVSTQFTKSPEAIEDPDDDSEDHETPAPSFFDQGNKITDDRSIDPFRNPPVLSADGKSPRVKSNIKANKAFGNGGGSGNQERGRNRVKLVADNIEFVLPQGDDVVSENVVIPGPEVRPDGRPPRVKANLKAGKQLAGQPRLKVPTSTQVLIEVDDNPGTPIFEEGPFDKPPLAEMHNLVPTRRPSPSFQFFSTKMPESPRVKSNVIVSQRNKFRGSSRQNNFQGRPQTQQQHNEALRSGGGRRVINDSTESPAKGAKNSIAQDPLEHQPLEPQIIDEIDAPNMDQVVPTELPEKVTRFLLPPGPQPSPQPQVFGHHKSVISSRPNKAGQKLSQRVPAHQQPQDVSSEVKVENTGQDEVDVEDGFTGCIGNPFKCPPTQVADGRKPRVKSNIKASTRNFFLPNGKTNRIKGKVKPGREAFNLRTRKGRASRGHNKNSLSGQAVFQNEFDVTRPEISLEKVSLTSTANDDSEIGQSTRKPFRHIQRRPQPREFLSIQEASEEISFDKEGEDQATTPLTLPRDEDIDYDDGLFMTTSTSTPSTLPSILQPEDPQFLTSQVKQLSIEKRTFLTIYFPFCFKSKKT